MIDTPMMASLGRFLDVATFRHSLITSNLANIDTPGYHTRDINFRQELDRAGGGALQLASLSPVVQRPPGLIERPDGNNVSLERESLLLAETQLKFATGIQLLRAEFRRLASAITEGK